MGKYNNCKFKMSQFLARTPVGAGRRVVEGAQQLNPLTYREGPTEGLLNVLEKARVRYGSVLFYRIKS